jgi:isoleucyl-tRNA synthetase
VLLRVAEDLARLVAPVLPFTADEVWPFLPGRRDESVHVAHFPSGVGHDDLVLSRWQAMLDVRAAVTKALEEARAERKIASSLEAKVLLRGPATILEPLRTYEQTSRVFPGNLANLFIVSRASLQESEGPLAVTVEKAPGAKCERCWTYSTNVGRLPAHPAVCERCAAVLEAR